ncbi:hypothetical protein [Amycolatopsis arida]|uniref:hypothetical protein n=1 Tax=Amycolatopsis arida TaxID=587909 RepID=UPI00106698C0|nr:hypothetical protein [Amycolatopsis arida]TDX84959.1 hypothetical protein CLV69_11743 [Amycolatopsis arida]
MVGMNCNAIPPSEAPALELPEVEPTPADLLALDTWIDEGRIDDRMHRALLLAAHEHTHRELVAPRHQLTTAPDTTDPSQWRAAA